MSKYHYNLETGELGICKAQFKCPLSNAPHFDTKEEAIEYIESLEKVNNKTFKKLRKNTLKNKSIDRDIRELKELLTRDGELKLGSWHSPEKFEKFKYLDKGAECNVYLSPSGKYVYKVPNDFDSTDVNRIGEILTEDGNNYEYIDHDFLRENNCEYIETRFINVADESGNSTVYIVQPYLNEEEYREVKINPFRDAEDNLTEVGEILSAEGFDDLEEYNIRERISDGRIILFDCLPYTDEN